MLGLATALSLALLIALPQLWHSVRYFSHSIRTGKTTLDKMTLGNVSFWQLLKGGLWPRWNEPMVDGVFFPEAAWSVGGVGLLCACWSRDGFWWTIALVSALLAMGKYTPLYRLTARLHLRIPARYTYFLGLAVAFLAIEGFSKMPLHLQPILLLLHGFNLIWLAGNLWPMTPYVQRWEKPSKVFNTSLTQYLGQVAEGTNASACRADGLRVYAGSNPALSTFRVSGLPYPLRTGQINHVRTLGYNGGSQATWMARFRQDANPNGSGAHDWFALNEDGECLDWYGVKYAYTYRPLPASKWRPTSIPHLYENLHVRPVPTWDTVARQHGDLC